MKTQRAGSSVVALIVGGLVGWSGYVLYGALVPHLPAAVAVGLTLLYLAGCGALAWLAIRFRGA